LLVFLEFLLGLRKGEIAGLMWSDIDFQKGVIHIQRSRVRVNGEVITKSPKSKAGVRDLWPGTQTMAILSQEYQKYLVKTQSPKFKSTGYVICKEDGSPFVPDSITQKWDRFKVSHNLPNIRFHDLRHTCATTMIANHVDPKTVQARLGHSDIHVTLNTYSHCLPSMNQAAGETMDFILK
jgi:integrase